MAFGYISDYYSNRYWQQDYWPDIFNPVAISGVYFVPADIRMFLATVVNLELPSPDATFVINSEPNSYTIPEPDILTI